MWIDRNQISGHGEPMVCHQEELIAERNAESQVSSLPPPKNPNLIKVIVHCSVFKIREHGIQARENLKIYAKRPQCSASGSSFGSVRFTECSPIVLVLVYGFAASIILLVLELLVNRFAQRTSHT